MNVSSAFFSCGLFLRIIQPVSPPVRTAAWGWSSIFVKTCFQNFARVSSTTVAVTSPALTISRMSSASRLSGAMRIFAGGLPAFLSSALSFSTLS